MHQTWAYRSDDDSSGMVTGKTMAKTQEEMYDQLTKSYYTIARELNIGVIPTGDAFHKAATGDKFKFKKDVTFNYTNTVYPQLPDQTNSLHAGYSWTREQKLAFDSHHASAAGCYLGGLVWYAYLFKQSPEKVMFKPDGVTDGFAKYLRQTAAETVLRKK